MSAYIIELVLLGVFILFILIKPDSLHDSFFKSKRFKNKNSLLEIIIDLEKINNENYDMMKHRAEKYFADKIITDDEYDKIETHLTKMYFKNYQKRFFPFVRSHWSVKTVYLSMLVFSFYYFNLGIAEV